jgi:hypothetical protein
MSFWVHCPACRAPKRVPDNAVGGQVQCSKCGKLFGVAREASLMEAPAVMDGAVAGALAGTASGVLTGIIYGGITGYFTYSAAGESAFAGAVFTALRESFSGLIIGFSLGVVTGTLLGIAIRFGLPALESQPRRAAALIGFLIGTAVALIVIKFDDLRWSLLGAVLGAGGASLWPIVRKRMAELVPTLEEVPAETPDETPASTEGEAEVGGKS